MKFDYLSIKNQLKNGLNSSRLDSYEIWSIWITNQLKNGPTSSRLDSYEVYSLSKEPIKEWPQELQTGFIWNWMIVELGINEKMDSTAPGRIYMKMNCVSIKNSLKNGLKSCRQDSYDISWFFKLRINQRIASRSPGKIHMKFDWFSINNQLKNGLNSSRLDSYMKFLKCSIKNQVKSSLKSSRLNSYEI